MAGSDSNIWARLDQAFAFGTPDENGGHWEVVDPSRGRPRTRSGSSQAEKTEHRDKVGINVTVIMPLDQQQQQFLQQQLEQRVQQWDPSGQPTYSMRSLQAEAVSSIQSRQSPPLPSPPQRRHASLSQVTLGNQTPASAFGSLSLSFPQPPQHQHQHHQRQLSLQEFQLQQQQQQQQEQQQRSLQQKPHSSHSHQRSSSSLEGFADRPLPPVPPRDLKDFKDKGSPSRLRRLSVSSQSNSASRPEVVGRRRSSSCHPIHRRNTSSSSSSMASYALAKSAPSPSLALSSTSPSSPKTNQRPPRDSLQNLEPTFKPIVWDRNATQQLTQTTAPGLTETVARPVQTIRRRRSSSILQPPTLAPLEMSPLQTTPAPATMPMPVAAPFIYYMSSPTVDSRPYTPLVQPTLPAPTPDTGKPPSSRHSDAAFSLAPKPSSKFSSMSSCKSSSSRSDDADAVSTRSESRRSDSPFRTLKSFSSSSRLRPSAAAPGKAVRRFMRLAGKAASSAKDAVSGPTLQKREPDKLYPVHSTSPVVVATTSASSSKRSPAYPSISTPLPQHLMPRHRSMSKIRQLTGLDMDDGDSSAVDPAVSASSLRRSISSDLSISAMRSHHASLAQTSSASASIAHSASTQSTKTDVWNTSMFSSDSEEDRDEAYEEEPTSGDAGSNAGANADLESSQRDVAVEVRSTGGEDVRITKNINRDTIIMPVTPDTPDLVTASLLQSLSQTSGQPPPAFQTANQSPYQPAFAKYQPYQPSYQSYQSDRKLPTPNRMPKSKRNSDPSMAPIIEHPDDSLDMDSRRSSNSHYNSEAPAEVNTEAEADLIETMIEKLQQETVGESVGSSDSVSAPEDTLDVEAESSFIPSRPPPVLIIQPSRPSSRSSLRPSDAGGAIPVSAFSTFTSSSLPSLRSHSHSHSHSSIVKHIPAIRLFPSTISSGTASGASSSATSPASAKSPSMPNISNPWPASPPPRPPPPPPLQLDDISEVDDDEHATGDGAEKRFSGSTASNNRSSVAMSATPSSLLSSSYHTRTKSSGSASESIANSASSVMSSVGSSVGTRATGGSCGYNGYNGYNGYSGYNGFSSFGSNGTNTTGSNRPSSQQTGVPAAPVTTNAAAMAVPAQAVPPQVYPPLMAPLPAPPMSAPKAHSPVPSLSQPAPAQDETRVQTQFQLRPQAQAHVPAQDQTPAETHARLVAQGKQPSPISAFDDDDDDEHSLAYRFKKSAVASRDGVRWRPSALGKSLFRREASPAPHEVSSSSRAGSRSSTPTPGSSSSLATPHNHRTSLSATSLKAAGQRMAQATRKSVGGGSTSGREQEKEKWRENLRSQIRIIPEGQAAGSSTDVSATTPSSSKGLRHASSRSRMI